MTKLKGQLAEVPLVYFINWNINQEENQKESSLGILMPPYNRLISVSPILDQKLQWKRTRQGQQEWQKEQKKEWMQNQMVSIKIPRLHKTVFIIAIPIKSITSWATRLYL